MKAFRLIIFAVIGMNIPIKAHEVEVDYKRVNESIAEYHRQLNDKLPKDIRQELKKCKNYSEIKRTSLPTQLWLNKNFNGAVIELAHKELEKLDVLQGDDYNMIFQESFLKFINNNPVDIKDRVQQISHYYEEQKTPMQIRTPVERLKINWSTRMIHPSNKDAVLHIGYFGEKGVIFYDRTNGIYYPNDKELHQVEQIVKSDIFEGR